MRQAVNTHELREGDLVLTHGMRVLVSNRTTHQHGHSRMVVHFDGKVLNPEEADALGLVHKGMRTLPYYLAKEDFPAGTYWAIQGNDWAHWMIETDDDVCRHSTRYRRGEDIVIDGQKVRAWWCHNCGEELDREAL